MTDTIERKYPKCKIINIKMKYDNESSAASTADKAKNVKGAVVAIENNGERCILYLSYIDNIWHITKDETYNG